MKVAADMKSVPDGGNLPEELRRRFIDVRTALFQLGVYDPVLVRFDSATAPRATTAEIAQQLDLAVTDF